MTAHTSQIDERVAQSFNRVAAADRVRVEAYVRSLAPPPGPKRRQESVLERLDGLEEREIIDETSVSVWGEAICLDGPYSETAACRRIEDRLSRFRNWASKSDASIELPFETQAVSSSIVEAEYERLVPPRVCLAIYVDEELGLVLPCEVDGEPISVTATLDWLWTTGGQTTEQTSRSTSSI